MLREPSSEEAAAAVRTAAREAGAFQEYADAFAARGRALARSEAVDLAVETLAEAALVYEEELEQLSEAAEIWEDVLRLQGDHRRALFTLGLLLHDLSRWDDLIDLYRRRLASSTDAGEQTTLHLYIAELLSDRKNDDAGAFDEIVRAARLMPSNLRIVSRVQHLGERTGRLQEVAVMIGDLLVQQDDPKLRAALSLRLAELNLGPLNDEQRALAYLRAALMDDGENPEILSEIEDVFRERHRFDALASILEEAVTDRRVGPHRVRLERELARIYETELEDLPRALAALGRAVRQTPEDRELLDDILRLGTLADRMDAVAEAYEHVVSTTDNPLLRTYMRLKLGYIYADSLSRLDDAARVFSAILDAEPGHEEAQQRLMRIREKLPPPQRRELDVDDDVYTGDLEALVSVSSVAELGSPAAEVDEGGDDDPLAAVRKSAVYSGRHDEPTEFEGQGFGPETETVLSVEQTAVVGAQAPSDDTSSSDGDAEASPAHPAKAEDALAVVSQDASGPSEGEAIAHDFGDATHADARPEGDDAPEAEGEAASSAEPADESEHSAKVSNDAEAVDASTAGEAEDSAVATEVAGEAATGDDDGEVLEVQTGDVEGFAVDEGLPPDPEVYLGDDGELVGEPSLAVGVISELISTESRDPASESEADSEPDGSTAREATPARRETPPLTADDPNISYTTVAGPVRAEHQSLLERFEVLQRDLAEAIEANDRVRIIHRLVSVIEIFEGLGQHDRALLAAIKLAAVAPREKHLQEILRLGRVAKEYPLTFESIERFAEGMGPNDEIHFGLLMADVEVEDLEDLSAAVARFERLADRHPENEVLLGRWLTVLDKQDQPEGMSQLLVERSLREEDPRLAFSFVQRAMAVLDERLEARGRATDLLRDFTERAPSYAVAREQLHARMLDEGRFEELADIVRRELEPADGEARISKYLQLSDLLAGPLDRVRDAEALLVRGLDEQPGSIELLGGLMRLAEIEERWQDVLILGQRQLDNASDPVVRTALRRQLADIAEHQADEPERAQELLATALDEQPGDLELIEQLLRLQMAQNQWSSALETLKRKWEAADSPAVRADVALDRARIFADQYDDLQTAMSEVHGALAQVPEHRGAMARMVELAEGAGQFDEAVRVLEQWATLVDGFDAAEVHVRRGLLLESAFSDPTGAARAYEAALLADVNHGPARRSLLRMAEAQEDYVRALSLAIDMAERSEDPRGAALAWQHAGRLAQGGVGDDLEALRCYERALAADPEDLATAANVGELLLARRSFAEAYPHLDRAARGLSDPDRSADLHASAAMAARHLGMHDAAFRAYEAVLAVRADDQVALDRLGAYLEEKHDWGRVHDLGAHLLLHHEDKLASAERAQVYLRMARAKLAEKDSEAGVRLARRADELYESEEVLEVLAEALDRAGKPFEAADCLKRLAPMRADDVTRRSTLIRAARLLGDGGVDLARAGAMASEAQALAPANLEVAELLCEYRRALGDIRQAATALWVPSQHVHGRPKANLLVRAARVLIEGSVARHQARRWLSQAVTIIPTHADALEDLRVILAFDGEYATLAQVQARAAEAFTDDPGTEVDAGPDGRSATAEELLRSNLDLYRFRLDSPKRALTCCQRLLAMHPEEPQLEEIRAQLLAELVRRRPEPQVLDQAVRAWNRALERRPGDPELIRQVAKLRQNAGQNRATVLLNELSAALGLSDSPGELITVSEEPNVDRLSIKPSVQEAESSARDWLDRLGYAPLVAFSDTFPEPRPRKRDLQTEATLAKEIARPLSYASARLGMDEPPVYVREDVEVPVRPTWVGSGPALMVAPDLGDIYEPAVVRFLLGRSLGLLRGRALALVVVPLEVLREGLLGLAKVPDPTVYLADPKSTKRRGRALERAVPAADRLPLSAELSAWFESPSRWSLADERDAVLRTADRAGLMVSGSLTAALQGLQVLSDGRTERAWRLPLLEYAASEACAELMERLD